jgi:hypothetical protein
MDMTGVKSECIVCDGETEWFMNYCDRCRQVKEAVYAQCRQDPNLGEWNAVTREQVIARRDAALDKHARKVDNEV